jgi:hypothetical protein
MTAVKAEKFVKTGIDDVIAVGMTKETSLKTGDIDPIVYEPEAHLAFTPR